VAVKGLTSRLADELDAWSASGLVCRLWLRDDDAVSDTPRLRRLLELADRLDAVIALAVVPRHADRSLAGINGRERLCFWQHGWSHEFHGDGEFGPARALGRMIEDALRGQDRLDELFGRDAWQRVFVPPNHALSTRFKPFLPALGYVGLSAGDPLTPPVPGVLERNGIDLMHWKASRLHSRAVLDDLVLRELETRRSGETEVDSPLGLITHHLAFGETEWEGTAALLDDLLTHPAVRLISATEVFGESAGDHEAPLERAAPLGVRAVPRDPTPVAVVVTSCGRQDLLARTLDSFFAHNTHPAVRVLVVEDGPADANRSLEQRFADRVGWLATGKRGGQVEAIDFAYAHVSEEYIFHCEDDWEFHAGGFIEKSLGVLESNRGVLQVWIRALDDTNGHPVLAGMRFAGPNPYRFLDPDFETEKWGRWGGFSWNPGLRRRSDYAAVAPYARFADANGRSYDVEREVAAEYARKGLLAAILADNDGRGYVRHTGGGRRVDDRPPVARANAGPPTTTRGSTKRLPTLARVVRKLRRGLGRAKDAASARANDEGSRGATRLHVVFSRPAQVRLIHGPTPAPAPNEVLVETECSLISSGTELACLGGVFGRGTHWSEWVDYPCYPGYSNIGRVIQVGSAVVDLEIGQRVATHKPHVEFVAEAASRCIPVPEDVSSEQAAWFALSSVVQIALSRCDPRGAPRAAVVGLGLLGQLTARWLACEGTEEIALIGRSPWRVQLAKAAVGARARDDAAKAQLTFFTASDADALAAAYRITDDHGTIFLLGDPTDPGEQRLASDVLVRGLTLTGVHARHASYDHPPPSGLLSHRALADIFFARLRDGRLDLSGLITHRLPPESAEAAYGLAAEREPGTMGILFDWTRR
jgi:2-desacetyl-2-hydroxyethyl bacteriochlorophyllide A dehydrogenase